MPARFSLKMWVGISNADVVEETEWNGLMPSDHDD